MYDYNTLITHSCFSYNWTVFAQHQRLLLPTLHSTASRLGFSIPDDIITSRKKNWESDLSKSTTVLTLSGHQSSVENSTPFHHLPLLNQLHLKPYVFLLLLFWPSPSCERMRKQLGGYSAVGQGQTTRIPDRTLSVWMPFFVVVVLNMSLSKLLITEWMQHLFLKQDKYLHWTRLKFSTKYS